MIVVDVTIPDGCTEGVEFPVDWGGTRYVLTVPAGSGPGKRGRDRELVKKVVWQWKADLSKDDNDPTAWKSYDAADSDNIEKMQARGVKTCRIGNGDYRVSFEGMFQYNKADTSKQRPIRRHVDVASMPAVN